MIKSILITLSAIVILLIPNTTMAMDVHTYKSICMDENTEGAQRMLCTELAVTTVVAYTAGYAEVSANSSAYTCMQALSSEGKQTITRKFNEYIDRVTGTELTVQEKKSLKIGMLVKPFLMHNYSSSGCSLTSS